MAMPQLACRGIRVLWQLCYVCVSFWKRSMVRLAVKAATFLNRTMKVSTSRWCSLLKSEGTAGGCQTQRAHQPSLSRVPHCIHKHHPRPLLT